MSLILDDALTSTGAAYREIYERQAPLLRFLNSLRIPVPQAIHSAAEIAVNSELRLALERPELNVEAIRNYVKEAGISQIDLDVTTLEYLMRKRLETKADEFAANPNDLHIVECLREIFGPRAFIALSGGSVGGPKYLLRPHYQETRGVQPGGRKRQSRFRALVI